MCGEKGYYFSNLNLKENDIVIMTIDPDIINTGMMTEELERMTNIFKPHPVIAVIKGIELSKVDKDKLIKYLQEN